MNLEWDKIAVLFKHVKFYECRLPKVVVVLVLQSLYKLEEEPVV